MPIKNINSSILRVIITLVAGVSIGVVITVLLMQNSAISNNDVSRDKEPLYWVAPMDSNFRRDKPGKSPMGMDLVPVYEESSNSDSPGTVKINPSVVNNLGVRTQAVSKERLNLPINTVGYVQYNEDKLVHIHPRAEGWIEAIYVNSAGEKVSKDQPLYTLYSPQLVNAQEEFLLAVSRNNDVLTSAAIARLSALQMPKRAINELQRNKQVMQSVTFYAPQSGVIDNLNIREGFFVKPATTLMSIASLDDVWVETEVFERMAGRVKVGQKVTMRMDYLPGRQWQGIVDYVYPNLDEQTRTLRARLRFSNQDKQLKPNMFAQITIHVEQNKATIVVPKEAVIRTGKQNRVVLALGEGQFKSVEVNLGQVAGDKAQIISGLEIGDEVVVSAQFLLDSESSIHSDFLRISGVDKNTPMHPNKSVQSATVNGRVNEIDKTNRIANISRGSIEKWSRGPATLDFIIEEHLNIDSLSAGSSIEFTFEIRKGDFVIVNWSPVEVSGDSAI